MKSVDEKAISQTPRLLRRFYSTMSVIEAICDNQ